MSASTVKVSIANRIYPVKTSSLEEEKIEKAAAAITGRIREFEKNYEVRDKQDLLAMCALQLAVEMEDKDKSGDMEMLSGKIDKITSLINSYLREN